MHAAGLLLSAICVNAELDSSALSLSLSLHWSDVAKKAGRLEQSDGEREGGREEEEQ